jgi:hypothetical protein
MFDVCGAENRSGLLAGLAVSILLGGCASTTILSSARDTSRTDAALWSDYASLPVEVHGTIPGHSRAELAAVFPKMDSPQYASLGDLPLSNGGRHIVMYINPSQVPADGALCSDTADFRSGQQDGKSAYVVGALCDGDDVVTRVAARVLTAGSTPEQLTHNLDTVRIQLFYSLTPGSNHPYELYPGHMYN